MTDYENFMNDTLRYSGLNAERLQNKTKGYQFVNNIPKKTLFIKLNPDISQAQIAFLSNGIRNFFQDQSSYVLIKQQIVDSFNSVTSIFNIFVAVIAAISLFIAFFLLLVASTQNVNDAIWEYGVLRSMGMTKAEGLRIYLYEAYIVVISAAILGTLVGFLTAAAVAVQFYSFIELPIEMAFPWVLFISMMVMSLITVMLAVCAPVRAVNNRQIAGVLKGQA